MFDELNKFDILLCLQSRLYMKVVDYKTVRVLKSASTCRVFYRPPIARFRVLNEQLWIGC